MSNFNRKRKNKVELDEYEFSPISKHLVISHQLNQEKRLIVILEGAQLETVKVGNNFELLNSDDYSHILKKSNRDPNTIRPDITHQCLLMLMDSPLNRAGLLQVYIHTEKNVLIEVNPQTRIPRTYKRFAGLMVQLLHLFSVKASDNNSLKLLKVIKNPITNHLPVGIKKYGTSFSAKKMIRPKDLIKSDEPIAIVIGAIAHGQVDPNYVEETISISSYPLSAALACSKICTSFEEAWNIEKGFDEIDSSDINK